MTAQEVYVLSMILIVVSSLLMGFAVAWPIARRIGYREGVEHVTESILDAEIIGDIEVTK